MVVDERAVHTWFIFSSAGLVDGRPTNPRVAKLKVHLFTFIFFLLRSVVDVHLMRFVGQNGFARGSNVAVWPKVGKRQEIDNSFQAHSQKMPTPMATTEQLTINVR